jgi:hypothetical protein
VAPARGDVGGQAGVGRVGAAMAATSLDDHVEHERESGHKFEHVWETRGEESLTPLIKNNRINLIIFGAQWRR